MWLIVIYFLKIKISGKNCFGDSGSNVYKYTKMRWSLLKTRVHRKQMRRLADHRALATDPDHVI